MKLFQTLFIIIVNIGALQQRWFSYTITKFNKKQKRIINPVDFKILVEMKKRGSKSASTAGAWYHCWSAQKVNLQKQNFGISYNSADLPDYFTIKYKTRLLCDENKQYEFVKHTSLEKR